MPKSQRQKTYIHHKNQVGRFIKFNASDKVVGEYVDYIWWYCEYAPYKIYTLRTIVFKNAFDSDNWPTANYGSFQIIENGQDMKTWFISVAHRGHVVTVARIAMGIIASKMILKFDFYGKWILVTNRDNHWAELVALLHMFGLSQFRLTRYDHAVDCVSMNRRKKNTLNRCKKWVIRGLGGRIEYLSYGVKGKSANFIRYYDKKQELIDRWTDRLYPDYIEHETIQRYELQVWSKGLAELDRDINVSSLVDLCNFDSYVPSPRSTHHKQSEITIMSHIRGGMMDIRRRRNIRDARVVKDMFDRYIADLLTCPTHKNETISP